MAQRRQVLCVVQRDRPSPHERITHLGGRGQDGGAWRMTQQEAVDAIEGDLWGFFVAHDGRELDVVVAVSRYGRKYLKIAGNAEGPGELLALPACP